MATPGGQFIFKFYEETGRTDELRNAMMARAGGPWMSRSGRQMELDIDNVNEVSRRPPGPAYGPVVYFAPHPCSR